MFSTSTIAFVLSASIALAPQIFASPTGLQSHGRAVTELNREAFEEAHKRDAGATRAFSDVAIKTSNGQCLFIDELSGDFRANLVPVQVAACGSTQGQSWDIITAGLHNNAPGKMLVVNTLTQACLDLNQGRVGREVTTFSCGGRAAGEGVVSVDQLFPLTADDSSFALNTDRGAGAGKCIGVVGSTLALTGCDNAAASQRFSIGGNGGNNGNPPPAQNEPSVSSTVTSLVAGPTEKPIPTDNAGCTVTTVASPRTVTVVQTVTVAAAAASGDATY